VDEPVIAQVRDFTLAMQALIFAERGEGVKAEAAKFH
jgi:hypothetical protein